MNDIDKILSTIDTQRREWETGSESVSLHMFAAAVNDLGYQSINKLKKYGVDADELIDEAIAKYLAYLESNPNDAVAHNNIGAFLLNRNKPAEAKSHLETALNLESNDQNIHYNMRIACINNGQPKTTWHVVPPKVDQGVYTLRAYFNPHGM